MSFATEDRRSSTPSLLKRRLVPYNPSYTQNLENLRRHLKEGSISTECPNALKVLISNLRDSESILKDKELVVLLADASSQIPLLGKQKLKLLVQVLLTFKWTSRGNEVIKHFSDFLIALCTAHVCHINFAFRELVNGFKYVNPNSFNADLSVPTESEESSFKQIHSVIEALVTALPLSVAELIAALRKRFPFRKETARCHVNYVHNMLTIAAYRPEFRREILHIIISKCITLDVLASREDILLAEKEETNDINATDKMEIEQQVDVVTDEDTKNEYGYRLDFCLKRLFAFLRDECIASNGVVKRAALNQISSELLTIFEDVILTTHGSTHTQFVLFYVASFSQSVTCRFLDFLWLKIKDERVNPVIRENCCAFYSGLLVRSKNVTKMDLKKRMRDLSTWIRNYISHNGHNAEHLKSHAIFYNVCEAFLYVYTFKYETLMRYVPDIKFMTSLCVNDLLASHLNPLQACSTAVVDKFIQVTSSYHVLSMADIHKSGTSRLNAFFPFDPYLLKRSAAAISPIYVSFANSKDEEDEESDGENVNHFAVRKQRYSEDIFGFKSPKVDRSDVQMQSYSPGFC